MNGRVAVYFAGRGLEYSAPQPLREPEHVDCALNRRLYGLEGSILVVNRGGRTGQIVDFVDFNIERNRHVMAYELKSRLAMQMVHIPLAAGEQVVDTQNLVSVP